MSKVDNGDKQLPLKRRVFYFDIKTSQNRNKLKNYITRLGGTVGEFLDNRVKYLITDRPQKDWPTKDRINEISQVQESSTSVNKVSDLLPRGKQLALRASAAPHTNTGTNQHDAIEIANKRGLKILQAQDVLDFCAKVIRDLENPSGCDTNKTSPQLSASTSISASASSSSRTKIRHFDGAFIKIEDCEEKYRPSAKEFKEWPKIYYDSDKFMCPFIPPSKVKKCLAENGDEANVVNTTETGGITGNNHQKADHNQLATNNTTTGNTISSRLPITPKNDQRMKTIEVHGMQTPRASTNATNDLRDVINRQKLARNKLNSIQFCEICSITFKNIHDHVNSATHQSHLKQKENFKDLFNVIKSLPKWTDICYDHETETENPIPNDDINVNESGNQFEYPNYPSLTPPSMPSTTITLTPCANVKSVGVNNSSATKGSFLPLHDYIKINNNNASNNNSTSTSANNSSKNFKVREVKSLTPGFRMRKVNVLGNNNNNNNISNIANNISIKTNVNLTSNFRISNMNYSFNNNQNHYNNNNNNQHNSNNNYNNSNNNICSLINSNNIIKMNEKKMNNNNNNNSHNKIDFELLFSDDDDNINEDEIEASCFTPPLIPPLLYPELGIPEEILRQKTINPIDQSHDDGDDDYSLEF